MNVGALESTTCLAPMALQKIHVLRAAHDVHQSDAVLEADLLEHLAQVRGRRGMHESGVTFHAHRLDHAEGRERVHEA